MHLQLLHKCKIFTHQRNALPQGGNLVRTQSCKENCTIQEVLHIKLIFKTWDNIFYSRFSSKQRTVEETEFYVTFSSVASPKIAIAANDTALL